MPTVNSNTVNLTLTSTWTCTWADDDHNSTYVSTASNTDTQNATFTANVPAGATITGRSLRTTWSNTGVVQTANVDGAALGASVDVRAVATMAHSYSWRASAAAMSSQGNYSRFMYVSAYVVVTYTDPVPPASTLALNKTTMDAGAAVTATITPQSTAYTHKLTYTFGSKVSTKTLAAGAKTWAFTFPLELEWLEQVPNATSKVMTVKLETFSGVTNLGSASKNITITVPASVVPTLTGITATLVPNGVDASITRYVQNYSKCALEITGALGAYGSTISSYKITGGGYTVNSVSGNAGPFGTTGDITFTATVTDSRGRKATAEITITVDAYGMPSLSAISAFRCDEYGTADRRGGYVLLKATPVISSIGEQNIAAIAGRVYMKGGTPGSPEIMASNTDKILGGGLLLPVKTYVAEIIVQDLLNTYAYTRTIPTDTVGVHVIDGALGAAFGKYAEIPGLVESVWPITAPSLYGHQNILHNPDFRNPVNQRAVTGEISTGAYFYDRWIRNSGTVTVGAGYLTLASGAVIEQRIEGNLLAGLICTVSFEVGGTIYHGSGAFPANNGTVSVEVDGYPDITLGCATGYMFVLIPATSETSIKRFKCEMGFVSTLAYDPPMDYAVEELKCMRFFIQYGSTSGGYGMTRSATTARLIIVTPVAMRAIPSVEGSGNLFRGDATHTGITAMTVAAIRGNQVIVTATTAGTQTFYRPCSSEFTTLTLSADL